MADAPTTTEEFAALVVDRGEVQLAVRAAGDPAAPPIVLVHGYPDTQGVWAEVFELLSDRFHAVTYDVRGIGGSAHEGECDLRLDTLADDLLAVVEAVSPDRPVHLVGHDWGAFQCWHALQREGAISRFRSFTSLAGPRIDTGGEWVRRRLRPWSLGLGDIAEQALRSTYILAAQLPRLPELALDGLWGDGTRLARVEGLAPRPGHPAPTASRDAVVGLGFYRQNGRNMLGRAEPLSAGVPVQLIVPTRDRYISTGLYADADTWASQVWRRDIRTGHWAQRTHPDRVAAWIGELVDYSEGTDEPAGLRRARRRRERRRHEGSLAIVTGAGAGIGRATARALAREGADVIAADLDLDAAEHTATLIGSDARAHPIELDVAEPGALERVAEHVEREYGVVDIVVNNAGVAVVGPYVETSGEDLQRLLDINIDAVAQGSRIWGKRMLDAGQEGHIVNIASAAAFAPAPGLTAYCGTKAAVKMLSEGLRSELRGHGIGVTAVCPGFIATDIGVNARFAGVDETHAERLRSISDFGFVAPVRRPESVAKAIMRALDSNPAVVTVTPEASLLQILSRMSPGALRAAGRLDLSRLLQSERAPELLARLPGIGA